MFDKVRSILDIDNSFFQFARKLLWVFILNIVFIITCLPIVTAGASMTAMNSVFMKIINERDFSVLGDYFKAFKANFIKSTIIWILAMIVGFILYVDVFYWAKYGIQDGVYGYVMLVFSGIVSLFFVMLLHTLFPLISRFEMSIKEYIVNGTLITLKNFLYGIEAVIFTVVVIGISLYMLITGKMLIMIYMLLICFGLNGLIQTYIYRRVLNRYSEEYVEMVKRVQAEMEKEKSDRY